jgi:hypothetical protein
MSWTPSSRRATLGILVAVVALAAVGTASALTVDASEPAPATVGDSMEYTATIEEPFRDAPDEWTLQGETALGNATWTVQVTAQGDEVTTEDFSGSNFTHDLDSATGATEVEITVSGDVTAIDEYSYDDYADENYTVMALSRGAGEGAAELETITGHRYTAASQEARGAIDSAIESVGSRNDKIDQAISSYDNGNFENARSLAEEAESGAQSGQLLLYGGVAVGILLVLAAGVYYWRQRQDQGYKLQ